MLSMLPTQTAAQMLYKHRAHVPWQSCSLLVDSYCCRLLSTRWTAILRIDMVAVDADRPGLELGRACWACFRPKPQPRCFTNTARTCLGCHSPLVDSCHCRLLSTRWTAILGIDMVAGDADRPGLELGRAC